LRALTSRELKDSGGNAVEIVGVELWQFETTRAAVEGIIRALVTAVEAHVNAIALRGLPQAYVQLMTAAGGIWSALPQMQGVPATPFDTLARIDTIAIAIKHRFVVWVEDLERFAPGAGTNNVETPEDAERLNPIRALLLGLDRLSAVTVVTATTSLQTRFDVEKIARFVEGLPDLEPIYVARILARFRQGCIASYDDIDPRRDTASPSLEELGNEEMLAMVRQMPSWNRNPSITESLIHLCGTPRTLKQSLRVVLEDWALLHGEIAFDDLFVATILRTSQPDVFARVHSHVQTLKDQSRRSYGRDEDKQVALKLWEGAFQTIPLPDYTRRAVGVAIRFLFPTTSGGSDTRHLQGVASPAHVDYWDRVLSRAPPPSST
jgi:hypothetical protein